MARKLRVTLVRSIIGLSPKQEATVRALGLRRIRHVVEHDDTPSIRGMIAVVPFAVEVDDGQRAAGGGPGGARGKAERSEAKS